MKTSFPVLICSDTWDMGLLSCFSCRANGDIFITVLFLKMELLEILEIEREKEETSKILLSLKGSLGNNSKNAANDDLINDNDG